MSVHRDLSQSDCGCIREHLQAERIYATPITRGVENTTYHINYISSVNTRISAAAVISIFEIGDIDLVHFISILTAKLFRLGCCVVGPITNSRGGSILTCSGRPALVFPFVEGFHVSRPSSVQLFALGREIARLHSAAGSFAAFRKSHRTYAWTIDTFGLVEPMLPRQTRDLFAQTIREYTSIKPIIDALPHMLIHGDLFRGNVIVFGDQIRSLIDFGNARTDPALLDIAIAINDWVDLNYDVQARYLIAQLVNGYSTVRPLTAVEQEVLNPMLRIAALKVGLYRAVLKYCGLRIDGKNKVFECCPDEYARKIEALHHEI